MIILTENYEIKDPFIELVVEVKTNITITDNRAEGKLVLLLKKGAKVDFVCTGNTSRDVVVETDAKINYYDIGSDVESSTMLVGENSACEHFGLRRGDGNWNIIIHHKSPNTTSNLHTRVLLGKDERARVDALIKIDKGCSGSVGNQKIETLLLDSTAKVYALPQLEIATDEVACSHSATITKLNTDSLFYLQSRGIPEKLAKEMLVAGFVNFNEQITKLIEVD